jgi:hypothetical protein
MNVYLFDCDMGQGMVRAPDIETATREAILDAGRDADVRNVHLATKDELSFRRGMGGSA